MSGLTLAVAPRLEDGSTEDKKEKPEQNSVIGGVMGSLRVIELQLVAFILVFSASGLVSLFDIGFPVFLSLYLLALSRWAFPGYRKPGRGSSIEVFHGSRMFQLYVIIGTTVGLFLPLAYILGGFARGDQAAVKSATPHLFLLSFQILSENIISGMSIFSPPVRALAPLLYTGRRLFAILDWSYATFNKSKVPENPRIQDVAWLWFGRGLAIANLLYFTINLFCFLIPRFLPRAFERYFQERTEYKAKVAEDKPQHQPQTQPQPSTAQKQKKSE
ncbi:hypothetical protein SUGI_0207140 [Cryptomeria japonica]|uniref:uncharacterized protein LOC131032670 isoform X1 n=1 Tax=Cryptomeria japonica TaxID=3369 RepID=UPI002408BD28|nr:uncharacterized protein LOC131032670 isoform X1 [Cryptomeria japonica]GLJ13191.1 hypothetical protein SUGI_0207140 [Cryptomeria japonica]